MVTGAGLSAAYPGFQHARKLDNEIEQGDIANQQARTGQEADVAWGNTIPVLQQMLMPGATPTAGGAPGGMAPPPGQPSQPMQRPQQMAGGPQPQMLGAPPPPSDPTWNARPEQPPVPPGTTQGGPASVGDRFGGLPGGAPPPPQAPQAGPMPPSPPQAPPQQPPMQQQGGQSQQPQQQGKLDLHTIMAAVVKANPGAKPAVIAAAVAKALPLMTAQSQMDYKNLMIQLGNTREQGRNDRLDQSLGSKETIAGANNETRQTIATGNQNTRRDVAEVNTGSREKIAEGNQAVRREGEEGKNTRADKAETGRNERTDKTLASQEGRTDKTLESRGAIADKREGGLNERAATRNEFLNKRIELQSKNLERQIARDGKLEDNARNRQTLKLMEDENNAEFKRSQQKISAQNVFAPNKSKESLMKDAETSYQNAKQRIAQHRAAMGGAAAPDAGPPPEAIKSLKEGHVTTFGNGQKWTLQNGKPAQVP